MDFKITILEDANYTFKGVDWLCEQFKAGNYILKEQSSCLVLCTPNYAFKLASFVGQHSALVGSYELTKGGGRPEVSKSANLFLTDIAKEWIKTKELWMGKVLVEDSTKTYASSKLSKNAKYLRNIEDKRTRYEIAKTIIAINGKSKSEAVLSVASMFSCNIEQAELEVGHIYELFGDKVVGDLWYVNDKDTLEEANLIIKHYTNT